MFDRKSDYALNKRHPDSIVCKSVTDVHIYLTRADFSSEADFLKWKEWSDRNYHQMDKAGRGFYDNCLPLDERIDSMEPSAEELLLRDIEQAGQEANCAVLMVIHFCQGDLSAACGCTTPKAKVLLKLQRLKGSQRPEYLLPFALQEKKSKRCSK